MLLLDFFSVTGISFLTIPRDMSDFRYLAHLLLSIWHLAAISFSREAPVAIASIILL